MAGSDLLLEVTNLSKRFPGVQALKDVKFRLRGGTVHALLGENESPDRSEISKAVAGNVCRCTGYQQIITSIESAVGEGR